MKILNDKTKDSLQWESGKSQNMFSINLACHFSILEKDPFFYLNNELKSIGTYRKSVCRVIVFYFLRKTLGRRTIFEPLSFENISLSHIQQILNVFITFLWTLFKFSNNYILYIHSIFHSPSKIGIFLKNFSCKCWSIDISIIILSLFLFLKIYYLWWAFSMI